eukprot:SAG31_NODE_21675_length_543_cov_1.500000_1_plen_36_part_10
MLLHTDACTAGTCTVVYMAIPDAVPTKLNLVRVPGR